jgi:uncharacterized damage-inducible protein DinB
VAPVARSLLDDAFAHHTWASLRLLDACMALDSEQLDTTVPGTYGSILDTARHLVGSDDWYLHVLTGGRSSRIDEDHMDLAELRAAMEANGPAWSSVLAGDLDPDTVIDWHRADGSETQAPLGIRLAQVVHHGTDHRSQICTALTTLGIEPPSIDLWDFGWQDGRVVEVEPSS